MHERVALIDRIQIALQRLLNDVLNFLCLEHQLNTLIEHYEQAKKSLLAIKNIVLLNAQDVKSMLFQASQTKNLYLPDR